MNIVQKIYLAPVVTTYYNTDDGRVVVEIEVNHNYYSGTAQLHPEDSAYFSPKVGRNIALSRARIAAISAVWHEARQYAQQLWTYYCRQSNCGANDTPETKALHLKALSAMKKAEDIRICREDEKRVLKDYLKGQDRAMQSLKRCRDNSNQGNTD